MLTLVDRSIMYQYRVLEDVFVRVDGLLFPTDFVILEMPKDSETSLHLRRPFLATSKAPIDVALGELILIFNEEKVIFNMFEALKHLKENPRCYQVSMVKEKTKKLHGMIMVIKKFQV